MRRRQLRICLIWQSYLLAGICAILAVLWPLQGALCALLLIFFDSRLHTIARICICIAIFACCYHVAASRLDHAESIIKSPPDWPAGSRVCGQIVRTQWLPENRLRIYLENLHPESSSQHPLEGICAWTWEKPRESPMPGQQVCIRRDILATGTFANEEVSAYVAALLGKNVLWRMWSRGDAGEPAISGRANILAEAREDLLASFLLHLWPDNTRPMPQDRAILPALLFGDRRFLARQTIDNFSSASIAHSLALSGQHLAVVCSIGFFITLFCSVIYPGIYLAAPKSYLMALLAVPLAVIYLWLGDAPASLQRACAMLCIGAMWLLRGRSFNGLDLLCGALLLILAVNPLSLFDTGLQLSALCVAIIILTMPVIVRYTLSIKSRAIRSLARIGLVSLILQVALLPLCIEKFHLAGLWFPFNILWLPVLGIIVLPLSALGLIFSIVPGCSWAAELCLDIASMPCRFIVWLLQCLDDMHILSEPYFLTPGWPALIAYSLIVLALAWLLNAGGQYGGKSKLLCALCLGVIFLGAGPAGRIVAQLDGNIRVDALDVGQGQCILVHLPEGMRLLVDGGGSYTGRFDPGRFVVAPVLSQNNRPDIDAVFNSHPDLDHLGGLFYILDNFSIGHLYHNGREAKNRSIWKDAQDRHNARQLAAGDRIEIGKPEDGLVLEVLHPPKDAYDVWQGNSASLVLRLARHGEGLILFTGDADRQALKHLLQTGEDLAARIVFAPHHGSDKNMLADFYEAARPELVLVNCGYLNRWKYPGKKLQAWLKNRNTPMFDTGHYGRISVTIDRELQLSTVKYGR